MQDYKDYEKNFNKLSLVNFGLPLKVLLSKKEHSENEKQLLKKYHKYSPVLKTNCLMNILCKSVEDTDFDIKYRNKKNSMLPPLADYSQIDIDKIKELNELYREYKAQRKYKGIETIVDNEGIQDDDMNEILKNILYSNKDVYRERMCELFEDNFTLFNHLMYMCYTYNYAYDCVWDIMEDRIVDIIPFGDSQILVEDKNGFEYLGKYYRMKGVVEDDCI